MDDAHNMRLRAESPLNNDILYRPKSIPVNPYAGGASSGSVLADFLWFESFAEAYNGNDNCSR
ncbi:MAG: hypothetical protein NBKEAIPA_00874 [Nitrospirae bacterium]|nr:hypothetical protein [Nitrospirota bacterium]